MGEVLGRRPTIDGVTLNDAADHFWTTGGLADEVWAERERQIAKRGIQARALGNDDNTWLPLELAAKERCERAETDGSLTWVDILHEEVMEAFAADTPEHAREELIQVMAVAAAMILDLDKRGDLAP